MKVVGLVTEYNPFHNGHLYHLQASKEATGADVAVAVMSGHFLQRGEPAILDKWTRAKAAVEAGVDLVIEIPTLYACASAEFFAFGSVALLNSLGIVDSICFGSEDGHIDKIDAIAEKLLSPDQAFTDRLQEALSQGHSFPKARSIALAEDFDFKANNILGIEYLKALKVLKSSMKAFTIKRIQAAYLSEDLKGTIASATAIRKHAGKLEEIQAFVPEATFEAMHKEHTFKENMLHILLYKIRTSSLEELRNIHDVKEGLEHKIKKAAESARDYDSLMAACLSKRFTKTRLQRIFVKILLNIKQDAFDNQMPRYARILAFNDKGKALLKKMKKTSNIPLVNNINKTRLDDKAKVMLDLDITASNIYNLLNSKLSGGDDYTTMPIQIKDE